MNKTKVLLIVFGSLAVLVFLAWVSGARMKMAMPSAPPPFLVDDLSKLTVAEEDDGPLPILSRGMPEFEGIAAWLNSGPISETELRGKVVLIDFWTYSCINCIRTLPYVTAWHEKYKDRDFVLIGVHTPEFAFEKDEGNVRDAIERHGIEYPVALDNDFKTWDAYANRYWPAHYLFDAQGFLRHYHFGEGEYDVMEMAIQELLREAGDRSLLMPPKTPGDANDPDFKRIGTPETYLGYDRMEYLASPEPVARDAVQAYSVSDDPKLNVFYFGGTWKVEPERAIPSSPGAKIVYRYKAATANLVMGPLGPTPARVTVIVDGKPVKTLTIDEHKLYELFDDGGAYGEHLLELIFEDTNVAAYAFTFG